MKKKIGWILIVIGLLLWIKFSLMIINYDGINFNSNIVEALYYGGMLFILIGGILLSLRTASKKEKTK